MRTDLAIVGAGPAGMAAACAAVAHGLKVVVVDEQARPGGQILRQPPAGFQVPGWLSQRIYRPQQRPLKRAEATAGIHWRPQTTVLGIDRTGRTPVLCLHGPEGLSELIAERVLIATGCYDMPVSFPGSTLPGVMAIGGIQGFVKSQQIVPGERFVFAGSHPLQLIVADQVQRAGGQLVAVLFSQPLGTIRQLLRQPGPLLRHPGKMRYLAAAWARLLSRGVPVRFGHTVRRAGGEHALQSVEVVPVDRLREGNAEALDCDRLGIGFGFLSSHQLAGQAGIACHWSDTAGGWLATHDDWMRSSVPGLFVAGETTGIGGADVSQREGEIAGLGIAMDAGRLSPQDAGRLARPARRALRGLRGFARQLSELSHPGQALLLGLMQDDAPLCKCEEVSVGEVRQVLDANPFTDDLSTTKLLSRCGMGMCQGRYCHYQLRALLSARSGRPPEDCGSFTPRFPVKPVAIADLVANNDSGQL